MVVHTDEQPNAHYPLPSGTKQLVVPLQRESPALASMTRWQWWLLPS